MRDCYQALQVPPDAGYQTIDAAYWRLARESRALGEMAPQALAELNEAYEILGNHDSRQRYDASREEAVSRANAGQLPEPVPEAAPNGTADEPNPSLIDDAEFVDLVRTQVRQVRDRMRARAAGLEASDDPAAGSPIGRTFGRLPQS